MKSPTEWSTLQDRAQNASEEREERVASIQGATSPRGDRPQSPPFGITWALVPPAILLGYFRTVTEIASEKNATTIIPIIGTANPFRAPLREHLPPRPGSQENQRDGQREENPTNHAFVPESARNARRSLSGATSTSISSPRANSPTRIFSDRGSSTYFCTARFRGRAP